MVSRGVVIGLVASVICLAVVNRARATCPEPGPYQVVVAAEPNYGEPCSVLEEGFYDTPYMGIADNTISSIKVGSSVRARLYRDGSWGGPQAPFEGGYGAATLPYGSDNATSSVFVEENTGQPVPASYVSAWPSNSSNFWIDNSDGQGLTHTTTDWILSATSDLYRVPLSWDLAGSLPPDAMVSGPPNSSHTNIPADLDAQGYDHFGDPDALGQYIFVPIEAGNADFGPYAVVAVFRASDLSYVSSNPLTGNWDHHSAWVAVQQTGPSTAYLYTSNGTLTGASGNKLQQYYIDLHGLFGQFLFYQGEINLWGFSEDGEPPINLETMQGGDLSPDGSIIYLSNSGGGGDGAGVRAFDLSTGIMLAKSENNYGPFNFKFQCCGGDADQEPEGVDYFDLNGVGVPSMPANSQLHVLLFDNFPHDYWVMHYTF